MLTKSDLSQIQKIMREEIEAEIKLKGERLIGEMKFSRIQIENDLKEIESRLKNIEIEMRKCKT